MKFSPRSMALILWPLISLHLYNLGEQARDNTAIIERHWEGKTSPDWTMERAARLSPRLNGHPRTPFVPHIMNEPNKYKHSRRIDSPLCRTVMKSTQALDKAIGLLCEARLKIIEIVQGIIGMKGRVTGAGNKLFRAAMPANYGYID